MTISLKKSGVINLSKETSNGLKRTLVGLGWDDVKKHGGFGGFFKKQDETADLDASVIMSGGGNTEIVYYGNLSSSDGSIHHTGDNLTGEGEGDDEVINIDFERVNSGYDTLTVVVNIFSASSKGQNFGMIENAYIHVKDTDGNKELVEYKLSNDIESSSTGVIVGQFKRLSNGEWEFTAVGRGLNVDKISDFKQYI
jgi:stress response protein SCP2